MHSPHGNGTDTNAIAILALGSVYGDDCVAWHTADLLKSEARLAGIVKKIGSPWELIDFLSEDGRIIVLDACISGALLGTLVQLGERPREIRGRWQIDTRWEHFRMLSPGSRPGTRDQ